MNEIKVVTPDSASWYEKKRQQWGRFYDRVHSRPDKLKILERTLRVYRNIVPRYFELLDNTNIFQNKDAFVDLVIDLLQPAFDLRQSNPDEYWEKIRKAETEDPKVEKLSEILYADKREGVDDVLFLHVASFPGQDTGSLMRMFTEGFVKLEQLLQNQEYENITTIRATGAIVKDATKRMLPMLGFVEDGEISPDEHAEYYPMREGPILSMHADRATLLQRIAELKTKYGIN